MAPNPNANPANGNGIRDDITELRRDLVGLGNHVLQNEINIGALNDDMADTIGDLDNALGEWADERNVVNRDIQELQQLAARIPDLDEEAEQSEASIRRVAARVADLEEHNFTTEAEKRLGILEAWMRSFSGSSSSGSGNNDATLTAKIMEVINTN